MEIILYVIPILIIENRIGNVIHQAAPNNAVLIESEPVCRYRKQETKRHPGRCELKHHS